MDFTSTRDLESQHCLGHKTPLLEPASTSNNYDSTNTNNPSSRCNSTNDNNNAINTMSNMEAGLAKAFKSTADLAKHLPTGCVLIFQILSPVFTNQGQCDDVNRSMAIWLVVMCSLVVFFLNFTDSFVDGGNNVCYAHFSLFLSTSIRVDVNIIFFQLFWFLPNNC